MLEDCGYETYNNKEARKEHKVESKENVAEDTTDKEMVGNPPAPLVTLVNKNLQLLFLKIRCTSTINKSATLMVYMHANFIFPKNLK